MASSDMSSGFAGPRRGLSRPRKILLAGLLLAVAFSAATARLMVWPAQGMPSRVSAIVMLAGPGDRLAAALKLAREHRAPMLVVSQGQHGYGGPCPAAMPDVKLICFDPDPGNTRGEAEFTGRLAKKYHWTSIVLVTSRSQDTRARMVVGRCFGGPLYVTTGPLALGQWPYQIAYEWGALVKALTLYRNC
jgi:uncharacterized SAM-binding protein YcdF (DUF218 family)